MKNRLYLLFMLCLFGSLIFAQTVEFSDDFESGLGNWIVEGTWATTTAQANNGTNSLTDSPEGDYAADLNISATLATGIDLSAAQDAELKFSAIYNIEGGNFDYCYVEASIDDGISWVNLATFLGEGNLSPWVEYTYSLGGFVGNDNVKVRFRLFTDGGYEVDGIYIDDVEITSNDTDNAAPLILHTAPTLYESNLGEVIMTAELIDISGINETSLRYTTDTGNGEVIAGINTGGNNYSYTIPELPAGELVDYYIEAADNFENTTTTNTYQYIAGEHVLYDDGTVDFVNSFGPDAASALFGCAVRFTLEGGDNMIYALIRNYTDIDRPNNDLMFHIWEDNAGVPGDDLITPFAVTPEATLDITSPMTRIDLRDYEMELSGLESDFFMGYTVLEGQTWLVQTTPAVGNRSYEFDGGAWALSTDDYHFRLVTTPFIIIDAEDIAFDQAISVYPNPAQHSATIECDFSSSRNLTVQVFNAANQLVWVDLVDQKSQVKIDLDLQHFANGVYFVQLNDGTNTTVRKLIVNK